MDKFVTVEGAEVLYRSSRDELQAVQTDLTKKLDRKVDGARVSEDGKYLYLTSNDEDVAGPYGPFSGGGGGGGSSDNDAILTVSIKGKVPTSISDSDEYPISIEWSSLSNNIPTGPGTISIKVNGTLKKTASILQGVITEELSQYLGKGSNTVRITISDVYNNTKTLVLYVSVISLLLESSFDGSSFYTGPISYNYIVSGLGDKTAYFKIDDELVGTQTVANSGRQYTYVLPEQTHGSHKFEVYFVAVNEGVSVTSNHLYYDLICYEEGNDTPVISVPMESNTIDQYVIKNFTYTVYTPGSQISSVQIYVDDVLKAESTVGQVSQTFSHRFNNFGTSTVKFVSGITEKEINLNVRESSIKIAPVTDNLALYLSSVGRSNTETNTRDIWEYDNGTEVIRANMTNFDWSADGWKKDDRGFPVLRLQGKARVEIPYKPFALPSDPNKTISRIGKTIEIEFSTSSVSNYEVPIISCFDNNRGFKITAQEALFKANEAEISTKFKENEHIRIAFVISKASNNRLIYCFTNGVISGITQYPSGEEFTQSASIVIGSDKVITDIYNIRVYDNDLTHYEVVDNWIADMQDTDEMLRQFSRNNVFNKNNVISISNLPMDLPYFVFVGKDLPTSKDSIPLDGYFVDNMHPEKNFTFTKAEVGCQGTSSMAYPIKNYKLKFKNAESWLDNNGKTIKKYAINDEAIPTNKFVFKADYASSEGANNVELVRFYNDLCKDVYLTPPQRDPENPEVLVNPNIRQGIDGFPMVVFQDRGDGNIRFIGKYNFNNDKGTPEVYGLSQNGEGTDFSNTDQSWEMKDNTNLYCQWKKAATSAPELLRSKGGFEARYFDKWQDYWDDYKVIYPETKENPDGTYEAYLAGLGTEKVDLIDASKLIELQNWVISTDPEKATGDPITPVTYEGISYNTDTETYRLAKFKAEVGDHFVLNDLIFYYIFTEFFLMIDSRVKNSFPTRFNSEGKWIWLPYDMDTAIGINNEGKLVYSYNLEDTDVEEDGHTGIFNGSDAVVWNNLRKTHFGEIKAMYNKLRNLKPESSVSGTSLSYEEIEKRFEKHQETWPAKVFNEDAYFKYVIPYTGGDPDMGIEPYNEALSMCLGAKVEQRKWWLYNRFRYLDSKYEAGLATEKQITFRAYKGGNIYITPYYDIYIKAKFGTSINFMERGHKGVETEVPVELEMGEDYKPHDTEVWINSADQIMAINGLQNLELDTLDISKAINLQELDLAATEVNPNYNLKGLTLDQNTLLRKLDARYCPNLGKGTISNISASQCKSLQKVYLDGTSITGIEFPVGGLLEEISLPNTIKSLYILGHKEITDLSIEGLDDELQITRLRIENVNPYTWGVVTQIMDHMPQATEDNKNSVRLVGFDYEFSDVASFKEFISNLDSFKGLNDADDPVAVAQVIGTATVDGTLDYEYVSSVQNRNRYPNLKIMCDIEKTVTFHNWDGTVLKTIKGTSYTDVPLSEDVVYDGATPYRADTEILHYRFDGWATEPGGELVYTSNVFSGLLTSLTLYAHYEETPIYTLSFYNYDGTPIIYNGETPYKGRTIGVGDIVLPNDLVLPSWGSVPMVGWGTIMYGSDDVTSENLRTIKDVDLSDNPSRHINVYAIMDWPLERVWVETNPSKMEYYATQTFDPTGMVIKGTKTVEGTQHIDAVLTKYTYPTRPLIEGETSIRIDIPNEEEYTTLTIGMADSVEIIKVPSRTLYFTGEVPEVIGTELKVTFTNGVETSIYDTDEDLGVSPKTFTEAGAIDVKYYYYNLTASYKVQVIETIDDENLDNNTWKTISAACESGLAKNFWHIGQEKTVSIGSVPVPGASNLNAGKKYFRIVAFDHNVDVESPGKHTITFGLSRAIINGEPKEVGFASASFIGTNEQKFDSSFAKGCLIRNLCNTFFDYLPDYRSDDDLQSYIKTVTKWQLEHSLNEEPILYKTYYADTLLSEQVKVFIPSVAEIMGIGKYSEGVTADELAVDGAGHSKCEQFEYYEGVSTRISAPDERKKWGDYNQSYINGWWLRSFDNIEVESVGGQRQSTYNFTEIGSDGNLSNRSGIQGRLFVPFFNI